MNVGRNRAGEKPDTKEETGPFSQEKDETQREEIRRNHNFSKLRTEEYE